MNKYKKFWINFWYRDITRVLLLLGVPSLVIVVIVGFLFGFGEYLRGVAMLSYVGLIAWAMIDNDYSNLRKIGKDEYHNKLPNKQIEANGRGKR